MNRAISKAFACSMFVALLCSVPAYADSVLSGERFTANDSILVRSSDGESLFAWQASKPMVPASLSKLATAHFAIKKWGLQHRFHTDFYRQDQVLWVKGYGDPFLVSEEIDLIAASLGQQDLATISAVHIDSSHFEVTKVPGRSRVRDPYNAPLSAVAANFNTAKLWRDKLGVHSAEPQTPLTQTAVRMSRSLSKTAERVNLMTADNAQQNFAELLVLKLGLENVEIKVNQVLDASAELIYRHQNTHDLANVLQGMLEFSNNFIANQVFLNLGSKAPLTFLQSQRYVERRLAEQHGWSKHTLVEGSGLSRQNRLSAVQIDDLLNALEKNRTLLKERKYDGALVHAKTGTLDGVRTYAGYISTATSPEVYRFVFMFNRNVPWRYREKLLERLVEEIKDL